MRLWVSVFLALVFTLSPFSSAEDKRTTNPTTAEGAAPSSSNEGNEGNEGMILITEGPFWMGRTRLWFIDEIGWQASVRVDDRPVHRVNLDGYWIDGFEVTQKDYSEFVKATGHRTPFHWKNGIVPASKERLPVYNVSWDDAVAFCSWRGKRLPTEAEWEKAARGGPEHRSFPWGDTFTVDWDIDGEPDPMAHFGYPEGPTDVGRFFPNDLGLYDTIGNVWEWVSDGYEQHYYSISPLKNPKGPRDVPYRIYRGGSWADRDDRLLSVYYRNFTDAATRTNTIGFRCARNE